MKCDRCKRGTIRQQLSVFVDCPVECKNLSKTGMRSAEVKILGAGWPEAMWYCDTCGYIAFNGRREARKKTGHA